MVYAVVVVRLSTIMSASVTGAGKIKQSVLLQKLVGERHIPNPMRHGTE